VQVDPDQFYLAEQSKYEVEGPKNLYDTKMLIEWYQKMCTDHPLLTYIEDGIRCGDIAGWQLMKSMLATKHEYVQIGVNKWFKSDIEIIKQFTQMI
jgi:enolase